MTDISTTDNASIEDFAVYLKNGWNLGIHAACREGRLDVANLVIKKGADDWNMGMSGACIGGHLIGMN